MMISPLTRNAILEAFENTFDIASEMQNLKEMRSQLKKVRVYIETHKLPEDCIPNPKQLCKKMVLQISASLPNTIRIHEDLLTSFRLQFYPPIGINNRAANCGLNSLMQLFANAPRLSRLIFAKDECLLLSGQLRNYLYCQTKKYQCPPPESQFFRLLLHDWTKGAIPKESNIQIDVADAIIPLIEKMGANYLLSQTITRSSHPPSTTLQSFPLIDLEIRGSFIEAVAHFFSSLQEDESRRTQVFFTPPTHLLFRVRRFGQVEKEFYKINDPLEAVPTTYVLTGRKISNYALTAAIIHIGERFQSGHYIALIRKESGFYLIDDATVFAWKDKTWHLLQKGREVTLEEAFRNHLLPPKHQKLYLNRDMLFKKGIQLNPSHLYRPQDFLGLSYLLYYQ